MLLDRWFLKRCSGKRESPHMVYASGKISGGQVEVKARSYGALRESNKDG